MVVSLIGISAFGISLILSQRLSLIGFALCVLSSIGMTWLYLSPLKFIFTTWKLPPNNEPSPSELIIGITAAIGSSVIASSLFLIPAPMLTADQIALAIQQRELLSVRNIPTISQVSDSLQHEVPRYYYVPQTTVITHYKTKFVEKAVPEPRSNNLALLVGASPIGTGIFPGNSFLQTQPFSCPVGQENDFHGQCAIACGLGEFRSLLNGKCEALRAMKFNNAACLSISALTPNCLTTESGSTLRIPSEPTLSVLKDPQGNQPGAALSKTP